MYSRRGPFGGTCSDSGAALQFSHVPDHRPINGSYRAHPFAGRRCKPALSQHCGTCAGTRPPHQPSFATTPKAHSNHCDAYKVRTATRKQRLDAVYRACPPRECAGWVTHATRHTPDGVLRAGCRTRRSNYNHGQGQLAAPLIGLDNTRNATAAEQPHGVSYPFQRGGWVHVSGGKLWTPVLWEAYGASYARWVRDLGAMEAPLQGATACQGAALPCSTQCMASMGGVAERLWPCMPSALRRQGIPCTSRSLLPVCRPEGGECLAFGDR